MSTPAQHDGSDRPNRIPWPPVLDVTTVVAAVALQRVWPLPALFQPGPMRWLGWLTAAVGVAIGIAGVLHFRRIETPIDPTGRATRIATGGIYAWTRNPMYAGTVLMFAGLGIAWPSTWLVALLPLLALGLFKLAIRREEAFLERRFGDEYRAYRQRVRRWF